MTTKLTGAAWFAAGVAATVLVAGGSAYAATGGTFILGKANTAETPTTLKNTGSGPVLKLPSSTAGQSPLGVSSTSGRVTNLNADKVDGQHASAFALASGKTGTIFASGTPIDFEGDGVTDGYAAFAWCPSGTKVTGGGFDVYTVSGALINRPDTENNGWLVFSFAGASETGDDVVAWAQCYNPRGSVPGSFSFQSMGTSQSTQSPVLSAADMARLAALAAKE